MTADLNRVVVFLDRDGVINHDRPDYVKSLSELEMLPGVATAIARLNETGVWVFVASNQAAIAKGLLTMQMLGQITQSIVDEISKQGASIDSFLYCPHRDEDDCDCRKPKSGLFVRGLSALPQPPEKVFVVGDSPRDIEAGSSIGAYTILVLSGKTDAVQAQELSPAPNRIVDDLAAAVEHILDSIG